MSVFRLHVARERCCRVFNTPVSPASPAYAMTVWSESFRVLSSSAFKIVTPRIAALDAATMVKSRPVSPISISLNVPCELRCGSVEARARTSWAATDGMYLGRGKLVEDAVRITAEHFNVRVGTEEDE